MRKFMIFTLAILALGAQAFAQNPFLALLGNSVGSEERLLYKKPAGPYEITIQGERLLERAYFKLDIRQDGEAISPDAKVEVTITPPESAGSRPSSYSASYDGEQFVVDPLTLTASQDWGDASWLVDLAISGPAGEGQTSFGMQVYAPKPDQSTLFKTLNVILPVAVLLLFLGVFSLRKVRLEQVAPI